MLLLAGLLIPGLVRGLQEARRVKEVLSANAETYAQIEGVLPGIDFRAQITRAQLEKSCHDLFDRAVLPLLDVVSQSGVALVRGYAFFGLSFRVVELLSLASIECCGPRHYVWRIAADSTSAGDAFESC